MKIYSSIRIRPSWCKRSGSDLITNYNNIRVSLHVWKTDSPKPWVRNSVIDAKRHDLKDRVTLLQFQICQSTNVNIAWSVNNVRCVRTYLLPQMSHPRPQNRAPAKRPMFDANDRKAPLKWNSFMIGAIVNPFISWSDRSTRESRKLLLVRLSYT